MAQYCEPIIGSMPVDQIDTGHVMRVLEPHWLTTTVSMARLRGRIENVLDWCKTSGYRTGENPARWRGHLSMLLPQALEGRDKTHFAPWTTASCLPSGPAAA